MQALMILSRQLLWLLAASILKVTRQGLVHRQAVGCVWADLSSPVAGLSVQYLIIWVSENFSCR